MKKAHAYLVLACISLIGFVLLTAPEKVLNGLTLLGKWTTPLLEQGVDGREMAVKTGHCEHATLLVFPVVRKNLKDDASIWIW